MHDDDERQGDSGPRSDEDEAQRVDRELIELLNELRVVMPGVQLLFGFLLTVPFQQRFQEVTDFQQTIYLAALIAAATATAFLIAPSAYHRVTFEQHQKPTIIRLGTVEFLIGLAALAVAMNLAVLLVTDVLFGADTVTVVVVCLVALYSTLWFGLGIVQRLRR